MPGGVSHDDPLQEVLEPMLGLVEVDEVVGVGRIIQVFKMKSSKPFTIGGTKVEEGSLTLKGSYRVERKGKVRRECTGGMLVHLCMWTRSN